MANTIRTGIEKPVESKKGTNVPNVIAYGIQSPGSDFDRRPDVGGGVTYVGPSTIESRDSSIKSGDSQKKKHVSSGKGQ